jgi:hypothetical protein
MNTDAMYKRAYKLLKVQPDITELTNEQCQQRLERKNKADTLVRSTVRAFAQSTHPHSLSVRQAIIAGIL